MRVLSCVPEQRFSFKAKVQWMDSIAKEHKPDLFVTPQEYFGGIQNLYFEQAAGEKVAYAEEEISKPMLKLARKHDMGIAVGALVDDPAIGERRERILIIDPQDGITGRYDKWALPAYDHAGAKGRTMVYPETDMGPRSKVAIVKGARVCPLFCWEVHAPVTWFALSRATPDFVLSMIKFGVAGWPQKTKDPQTGQSWVSGFGFGNDGGWIERLHMGAKFDVVAPVVCSTNSWDLPKRSRPLAGTIFPFDEESTLWHPAKGERGTIEQHVQVDEIDHLKWRMVRENKFQYNEVTGDWPSGACRAYTMAFKTRRMEKKIVPDDVLARKERGLFE